MADLFIFSGKHFDLSVAINTYRTNVNWKIICLPNRLNRLVSKNFMPGMRLRDENIAGFIFSHVKRICKQVDLRKQAIIAFIKDLSLIIVTKGRLKRHYP